MGYYGGCDSCALETQDHTNLYMTRPWEPPAAVSELLPQLQQAMGQKVMLGIPQGTDVRALFQAFKAAGVLDNIVALYPIDEPDVAGKTDAEITAANAALRQISAEFGVSPALAVIYQCVSPFKPGIASYDWIGCDDYGSGCDVANGKRYKALKDQLSPQQRLMLVPGGANPWRQDPQCFLDAANGDSQVVAILAFLWVDYEQSGIRVNGMRAAYCKAGRAIKGVSGSC